MACSSFNLSFHNILRDCACDTLLICHWVCLPLESSLMILERHPSSGKMFWDWNPPPPPAPYSPCWNFLFSLIIFILCQRKRSWKMARIWERKGVKRKTGNIWFVTSPGFPPGVVPFPVPVPSDVEFATLIISAQSDPSVPKQPKPCRSDQFSSLLFLFTVSIHC
jgi:hypothetical protein